MPIVGARSRSLEDDGLTHSLVEILATVRIASRALQVTGTSQRRMSGLPQCRHDGAGSAMTGGANRVINAVQQ
jgi:hypothetical protein